MTQTPEQKNDRFFRMLGLARRAGKLAIGTPLTLDALHRRRAFLLLVSEGASASTRKKMETQSAYYHVPLFALNISPEELARLLGKQAPVVSVAVTDEHFATELTKSSGKEASEMRTARADSEHGV